jgi:hypothetical protein
MTLVIVRALAYTAGKLKIIALDDRVPSTSSGSAEEVNNLR